VLDGPPTGVDYDAITIFTVEELKKIKPKVDNLALDIVHPLFPDVAEKKRLIHSSVYAPKCELIYRGSSNLVNGVAFIDLNTECKISQGTFEVLCKNPQVFLQNSTNFDRVIGNVFGGTLNIQCENNASRATISWMVVAERNDSSVKTWSRVDETGSLVPEYVSQ
jgi:hypothetical protein